MCAVCCVCFTIHTKYDVFECGVWAFRKKRDNKLKKFFVVQTNSQDFDCFFSYCYILYTWTVPAAPRKWQTPDTGHQRIIINDQIYIYEYMVYSYCIACPCVQFIVIFHHQIDISFHQISLHISLINWTIRTYTMCTKYT